MPQVVVAESFDQVVNDLDKDVLIQFFSPLCPHCKKLEPVYKELAEMVRSLIHQKDITLPEVLCITQFTLFN